MLSHIYITNFKGANANTRDSFIVEIAECALSLLVNFVYWYFMYITFNILKWLIVKEIAYLAIFRFCLLNKGLDVIESSYNNIWIILKRFKITISTRLENLTMYSYCPRIFKAAFEKTINNNKTECFRCLFQVWLI